MDTQKDIDQLDYFSKINIWLINKYKDELFSEFNIDTKDLLSVTKMFDAIYNEQCKVMPLPWYEYGIGKSES